MERILPLRKKIDEIDEQILHLLKKRMEICRNIGKTKQKHGMPVKDHKREDEVYANVIRQASALELNMHEIIAVYKKIIAMSINVQESEMKIACARKKS